MVIRLINAILLLIILVGLLSTYRADRAYRKILAQHERLEARVGCLRVTDTTKLHVWAVKTGEQMHFAWRVYIPAGMTVCWHNEGNVSKFASNGCELIVRIRIDENSLGILELHTMTFNGQKTTRLGDPTLANLLRNRWSEIRGEQLSSDGVYVVEMNEVATLLRLTLSEPMKREAKEKLDEELFNRVQKKLALIQIGSAEAFSQTVASE